MTKYITLCVIGCTLTWPSINVLTYVVRGTYLIGDYIKVGETRRGNQEWTIQRNWQHWVHKTQNEEKCLI